MMWHLGEQDSPHVVWALLSSGRGATGCAGRERSWGKQEAALAGKKPPFWRNQEGCRFTLHQERFRPGPRKNIQAAGGEDRRVQSSPPTWQCRLLFPGQEAVKPVP